MEGEPKPKTKKELEVELEEINSQIIEQEKVMRDLEGSLATEKEKYIKLIEESKKKIILLRRDETLE